MPGNGGVYQRVVATGVPNYRGVRVQLGHAIRADEWRKWSHIHGDASLPDMLEYGFPCGFVGKKQPATGLSNHASAVWNPKQVEAFLRKECSLGAMLGPFKREPFVEWWRNNPLMTRPKRNSADLRVILDLSFPAEASVNGGIPRGEPDGANFKMKLPSPLDLASIIRELGVGCMLYKMDLSRAYRQLRSDPLDWPFLGVKWEEQCFIDIAIPFGLRHGASACQRVSEAAAKVAKERFHSRTEAYVDDTAGAALPAVAMSHYVGLLTTLNELGLETAAGKCEPPATGCSGWVFGSTPSG